MADRAALAGRFLVASGWAGATRRTIAGDASARRYERVTLGQRRAILMDSPPGAADDPADFVKISGHLRGIGLNAPEIHDADLSAGFLLLEDFGDDTFARVLARSPDLETRLYALACDVLVRLQAAGRPDGLADLSADHWADAAMVALDWYRFAVTGDRGDTASLQHVLSDALRRYADGPRVMILRDYHAENLMWLPDRQGLHRAGLLDFQLGQLGQPGYDLVSLLQDARRDVAPSTEADIIARFCAATGADNVAFGESYAVLGIQRALRILGVFARLCLAGGKPGYLGLVPRVWAQLRRNLDALALAPLSELCDSLLPEPTTANLETIARKCAQIPPP
ncbi:MAG: phosphotransferase [Pseudomonadota bacterium]